MDVLYLRKLLSNTISTLLLVLLLTTSASTTIIINNNTITTNTTTTTTNQTTGSVDYNVYDTGADDHHNHHQDHYRCQQFQDFNFSEYEFPNREILTKPLYWTDYLKIIACFTIILVILLGNMGVVVAVGLNRSLRNTINYYLTNLAVADIMICLFCLWVHLINNLTEPLYVLGPYMCKLNGFAQMTCLTSSVLTLSAISCDRFVAIFCPLRSRVTKQRTGSVITGIWIISLIISVPFLIYRKHHEIHWKDLIETSCIESWPVSTDYSPLMGTCIHSYPIKRVYYIMVTVILFFVPVLVMATAYSLIVWRLWVHKTPGELITNTQRAQRSSKKKVVKMVCLVLLCFVICWMPLQIIVLYSLFGHSANDSGELPVWFSTLSYISTFIAYCNSALNPVIYGGFNRTFRQTLYSVIKCDCRLIHRYRVNQTIADNISYIDHQSNRTTSTTLLSTTTSTTTTSGRVCRRQSKPHNNNTTNNFRPTNGSSSSLLARKKPLQKPLVIVESVN